MTPIQPCPKEAWQQELIQAVTDPQELYRLLDLNPALFPAVLKAGARFPLKVPRGFIARMQKGNPADPLLRQILPLSLEDQETEGYSRDPLREAAANPLPGLLHKYQGRVLLTVTGACAVNCRYCFRRHFPYTDNNPNQQGLEKILAYVRADPSIREVLLSGGDPLLWNDRSLQNFTGPLAAIEHVKRLRIHSRIPIVLPERITDGFLSWLSSLRQKPILVTHCNHPQELSAEVIAAMQRLKSADVLLLNQAVLLKGVNDEVATLVALSEALFSAGIQPYYLHLFDKVQNAAHFDVDWQRAQTLYRELSHHLPGYLLPKLARENPSEGAKQVFSNEGPFTATNSHRC